MSVRRLVPWLAAAGLGLARADEPAGWYRFEMPVLDGTPTAVHIGALVLDAPAGKHGFLRAKDGHLAFEDGTPARLWGTNLTFEATMPPKDLAPRMADRLAKLGYNAVRFHHLDTPRSLFKGHEKERGINAEMLDRLDFFFNELKKRGIYGYFCLQSGRTFVEADGIPAAAETPLQGKLITLFHPDVIALNREFARRLLTHRNPYTGLRYADDPALAAVEITNENSLWSAWITGGLNRAGPARGKKNIPAAYIAYLDGDFGRWLLARYGSREGLAEAWQDLKESEDPARGTVERVIPGQKGGSSPCRMEDMLRYYAGVERRFFEEMRRFVKEEMKFRGLVGTTQFYTGMPGMTSQMVGDYLDTHGYWDHPRFKDGKQHLPYFKAHFKSLVENPLYQETAGREAGAAPILRYALSRMKGKPLMVSEWQASALNPFAYEVPLIVSAYSGFHDWDGLFSFVFAQDNEGQVNPGPLEYCFQMSNDPACNVLMSVAGLAFQRRYVRASPKVGTLCYGDAEIFDKKQKEPPFLWWGKEIPDWAPYVLPLERDLAGPGPDRGLEPLTTAADPRRYVSQGGEIVWDVSRQGDEHVAVDAPCFQAVIGHLRGRKGLKHLETDGPGRAAVAWISLDGKPLAESGSSLLVAVGEEKGVGEQLGKSGEWTTWTCGYPPLLQSIDARVSLKDLSVAERLRVYPLDGTGRRGEPVAVERQAGGLSFQLRECRTPWFEVARE